MKFLLIEDDAETAAYIVRGLKEHGHNVDHAPAGRDGLFLAGSEKYDTIILDRMLPGMDGLSIVKMLRSMDVKTPILFLTAMGGIDDRVDGLNAGGDDYLVKPFGFAGVAGAHQCAGAAPPALRATDNSSYRRSRDGPAQT